MKIWESPETKIWDLNEKLGVSNEKSGLSYEMVVMATITPNARFL